jgi:hypothetical protein
MRCSVAAGDQAAAQEEGWVICRVFKKKNLAPHNGQQQSSGGGANATAVCKMETAAPTAMESSPTSNGSSSVTVSDHVNMAQMLHSASDDVLDHILQYMGMGRSSTAGHDNNNSKQDTKPPALLDHHHLAAAATTTACPSSSFHGDKFMKLPPLEHVGVAGLLPNPADQYSADASGVAEWDSLDRLDAYELNGLYEVSKNMVAFFDEPTSTATTGGFSSTAGDGDLWSLARSSVSSLHADLTMNNV